MNAATVYDESKIKTLSSLEHIRLRPGMYIGRLGNGSHPDDGIYILLKEVIDNAIDEFIMGAGKRVNININDDGTIEIRDFGRGIPLGKLVECVSVINTGAKYNTDVFQFSVGLNGVGTKAVNALSEYFEVVSFRDGKYAAAFFENGVLQSKKRGKTTEKNGTLVKFRPDHQFFADYSYNHDFIGKRLLLIGFDHKAHQEAQVAKRLDLGVKYWKEKGIGVNKAAFEAGCNKNTLSAHLKSLGFDIGDQATRLRYKTKNVGGQPPSARTTSFSGIVGQVQRGLTIGEILKEAEMILSDQLEPGVEISQGMVRMEARKLARLINSPWADAL